jgi:branched-chain amino acid transport system substrate-binding protein
MRHKFIARFLLGATLALMAAGIARADDKVIKIGVLTDLSGLYADLGGQGSIEAAKMAGASAPADLTTGIE